MAVMTKIIDIEGVLTAEEIDTYVGGVYITVKHSIDSTTGDVSTSYDFNLPVPCE